MSEDTPVRPLRILVVENHADTVRWLTFYLEDCGHTVFTATTVAEALGALSSRPVDVLLSDIGLPDGTGWDLLPPARAVAPHIFAIAMSGFSTNADNERSRAAGFCHHLSKPFQPAVLDGMLSEAAQKAERGEV